jgi:hypothetical protein
MRLPATLTTLTAALAAIAMVLTIATAAAIVMLTLSLVAGLVVVVRLGLGAQGAGGQSQGDHRRHGPFHCVSLQSRRCDPPFISPAQGDAIGMNPA